MARTEASLNTDGLVYNPGIKVGIMIKIPVAMLTPSVPPHRMDFLSIGTNDLTQYTLTIDYVGNAIAHLYDLLHPAVLQLITRAIRGAHQAGKPVSVCGEMAGDVSMTRLPLGMDLAELSIHPS